MKNLKITAPLCFVLALSAGCGTNVSLNGSTETETPENSASSEIAEAPTERTTYSEEYMRDKYGEYSPIDVSGKTPSGTGFIVEADNSFIATVYNQPADDGYTNGFLLVNQEVKIYEEQDGFTLVKSGDTCGYVKSESVSKK